MLIPRDAEKDELHRLRLYVQWLEGSRRNWLNPDLAAYRDDLLTIYVGRDDKALSPTSVRAHLSTVRGRYQAILRDNRFRQRLYEMTPAEASPADRKAFVDETIARLRNAIHPDEAAVKIVTRQDRPDDERLRLTASQATALLHAPGTSTLMGLRDTVVIALMLCTGIREAELCALEVTDLRQRLGGQLALHVRHGKGRKERLVPYGDLDWVLVLVEAWLSHAEITGGAVLRGFYKGGKRVRKTALTVRAINQILDRYPIMIDGELTTVNPHDLRRTYARRLYEAGMDLLAIRDNLGHVDSRTTLEYIGTLDAEQRKPPALYVFDVSRLGQAL